MTQARDEMLLSGGGASGRRDDVGQKTKAIVTTSMRKVKDGTSQGFQWIKDKCQRNGGGKKQQDSEAPRYC
ncbi:hypothetical protein ZEAMMB73_Zm00001d024183 [Zea mays]|uniref:Uncharacterized protein n=1 Tax=Zea mays TaxID=4577 RepID=A0A1D6IXV9_MAIZE|nr:hypothetical protein ZEAMMB73_Zm00001d024183 [Zea mays]